MRFEAKTLALHGLAAALLVVPTFSADAQQEPASDPADNTAPRDTAQDNNGNNRNRNRGDRNRRSPWNFPDDATSNDNDMLKRILDRYPDADANKDGVLDATEGRAFVEKWRERRREDWRDRRGNRLRPTHNDIAYGTDSNQVIDFYLAESETPTPLVIYFHDGQFITGDERDLGTLQVRELLSAGISVASVDYRDVNIAPFPAPFDDAAKALQFIRFYADQINIDPARIAGHGEEAGGNLALYLGLHDNRALTRREVLEIDPEAYDHEKSGEDKIELPRIFPVEKQPEANNESESDRLADEALDAELENFYALRPWEYTAIEAESTRLVAVVARHPIASFDPRQWERLGLPMNKHERLMRKYLDVRYLEPVDDDDVIELVESVSPIALATQDDPEVLLMSQYKDLELKANLSWTIMRHHPKQAQLIATALRSKGVRATVRYREMDDDPGTSSVEFFTDKLN